MPKRYSLFIETRVRGPRKRAQEAENRFGVLFRNGGVARRPYIERVPCVPLYVAKRFVRKMYARNDDNGGDASRWSRLSEHTEHGSSGRFFDYVVRAQLCARRLRA